MASALSDLVRAEPKLVSVLTADSLSRLSATGSSQEWREALARMVLRNKVWGVRRKSEFLSSYTIEKTEEILASFSLDAGLASQCGLEERAGQTWLDAVHQLLKASAGDTPADLWARVEEHPMVQYIHAQCQTCGNRIPDQYPSPEDPNLTEETPNEAEQQFVRAGWFRGPRGPVVFVYRCPECGQTSRWYRSVFPEITLNPSRWGRLCGEQEDLKLWLAKYLGVRLRVCCPLDWDHVWTEVFDGTFWQPLDPNCINFARRLHEGIGAWTGVLALGSQLSGNATQDSEDVTQAYLSRASPKVEEMSTWLEMISAARADASGRSTQSHTLCGHVLDQAGFDHARVTEELQMAQLDFDKGIDWWDLV